MTVKSSVNLEIRNGTTKKVVHINRIWRLVSPTDTTDRTGNETWHPPQVKHFVEATLPQPRRNPPRSRRPPDY